MEHIAEIFAPPENTDHLVDICPVRARTENMYM